MEKKIPRSRRSLFFELAAKSFFYFWIFLSPNLQKQAQPLIFSRQAASCSRVESRAATLLQLQPEVD
jgi:hypothetical protein